MSQAEALEYFKLNSGYARMKDLKARGIHPRVLRGFVSKGVIEKIKPGIYKLSAFHASEHQILVDICMAVPKGIVCLYSALHFYGLCDTAPEKPMLAVPQGYRLPKVVAHDFQSFFFSPQMYQGEDEEIMLDEGRFRIYSREKALVDAFRFKKRLGAGRAQEALERYAKSRHRHLGRLLVLAKQCRVLNAVLPCLNDVI